MAGLAMSDGLGRRRPRMAARAQELAENMRPWNNLEPPAADKQKPALGSHPRAPGTCEWCGKKVRHMAAHKRACPEKPFP